MKIAFFSNFFNHHQVQLCDRLSYLTKNNFYFVATSQLPEERRKLGYREMDSRFSYVIPAYESDEKYEYALTLALECDVVIIGSAPDSFVSERVKRNKITFRYRERVFKEKPVIYKIPYWIIKNYVKYHQYKNQYVLCASAYTAKDFRLTFSFLERTFKWGYFPETIKYTDIKKTISRKRKNSILWVGRLIDWKHPEIAIYLAKMLKNKGYEFNLSIIGMGDMEEAIQRLILEYSLQDNVQLLGAMSPEQVREHMLLSEIFLFTSDRNEGWGAVLNESMNSGCAVVANKDIGAVPYLLEDDKNGLIYTGNDVDQIFGKVVCLLTDKDKRVQLSYNAYKTIVDVWNAEEAAKRFIDLCDALRSGKPSPYSDGPCSRAD